MYSYKRNTRAYGKWQLIQANLLFSLAALLAFLLARYCFAETLHPAILYTGSFVLIACVVGFNGLGILNIRKDEDFEFTIDENRVSCKVPVKAQGQSFELSLKDIERILIESAAEGLHYSIVTKKDERIRIPDTYGNKVHQIIDTFESAGIPVER